MRLRNSFDTPTISFKNFSSTTLAKRIGERTINAKTSSPAGGREGSAKSKKKGEKDCT